MAQRILSPLDPALLSCSLFLCGDSLHRNYEVIEENL